MLKINIIIKAVTINKILEIMKIVEIVEQLKN